MSGRNQPSAKGPNSTRVPKVRILLLPHIGILADLVYAQGTSNFFHFLWCFNDIIDIIDTIITIDIIDKAVYVWGNKNPEVHCFVFLCKEL